MSGKTHKSIFYHIVFATKGRQSFLNDRIQKKIYHFIWNKCKKIRFYLHRIGGIEEHIHMLIYIPPKISVSKAVGLLKGSSSYFINQELEGDDILYWQKGYGVITVCKENFRRIYNYIKNQEEHHRTGNIIKEYEEINVEDDEEK
ncbi:MAG: IS200/IS605 family transposase [Candidatus Cloacimonetes bacterium]|nr:IS200/IS605 family transposase [Candidatus Cloacimonadota bacterium]